MIDVFAVFAHAAADYPAHTKFVPLLVLMILLGTALIDARTGRVPDVPIALGLIGTLGVFAFYKGWMVAGERFLYVVAAVLILRGINDLYRRFGGHDAFGMGDAKWTALAVAGFGWLPLFWAWIIGAWLGLFWMGLRRIFGLFSSTFHGKAYVHFAPFLFLGLLTALVIISS